jgi:paraquat-inducible protein A
MEDSLNQQLQPSVWAECRSCGVLQSLPNPAIGFNRICWRCYTPFGSGIVFPHTALAIAITSLLLFLLAQCYPIMRIEVQGQSHAARIISGVTELANYELPSVGLFVLAIAIAAPLGRILCMIWIMAHLLLQRKSPYLLQTYKISEHLQPWAMLDVLLLGSIVASSKLRELTHLSIGIGFWSLGVLALTMIILDLLFDRQAIWDLLYKPEVFNTPPDTQSWVSCHFCHLLQKNEASSSLPCKCPRCDSEVRQRKKASFDRTWALVIAGFILYIPANIYPVITTISFGLVTPSTIMGGVRQLINGHNAFLAAILFAASIMVPLLKLLGLTFLMISTQLRSHSFLINRTRLYRCIIFIGRWSNTDIFVGAMLTGLVTLGNLSTVIPGNGALAFGAVVILTMVAAETFDTRLMWDAAEQNNV